MLKRVQKRIQRKEKEAALGLDEETREILGLNDTDSDESDSSGFDSDSDLGEDTLGDVDGDIPFDAPGDWEGESLASEEEEEAEENESTTISVQQAMKDPIYVSSLEAGEWKCIICPGKVLKGSKMIEVHREAKAHKRRLTQFTKLSASAKPDDTVASVLQSNIPVSQPKTSEGKSNRALKKEKSALLRKEQRAERRTKRKAKATKESTEIAASSEKPKVKSTSKAADTESNVVPPSKPKSSSHSSLAELPVKRKRKLEVDSPKPSAALEAQTKKKPKRGSALIEKYLAKKSRIE
ncbi:hypothetical protein ONZ45_g3537 [Pleurotus djamor]|nr:hypothetical protein ONZ45_g3537 [Pleurotus djamor]